MSYCIWWGMNLDGFFEAHQEYRQLFEARAEQQPGWKPLKMCRNVRDVRLGFWRIMTQQEKCVLM